MVSHAKTFIPYYKVEGMNPSLVRKSLVRHVKLFLPYYKVEGMNPSVKPKSLINHVTLFLPYYKVEESKEFEDSELDDVYVAPTDDSIFSSGDKFDE